MRRSLMLKYYAFWKQNMQTYALIYPSSQKSTDVPHYFALKKKKKSVYRLRAHLQKFKVALKKNAKFELSKRCTNRIGEHARESLRRNKLVFKRSYMHRAKKWLMCSLLIFLVPKLLYILYIYSAYIFSPQCCHNLQCRGDNELVEHEFQTEFKVGYKFFQRMNPNQKFFTLHIHARAVSTNRGPLEDFLALSSIGFARLYHPKIKCQRKLSDEYTRVARRHVHFEIFQKTTLVPSDDKISTSCRNRFGRYEPLDGEFCEET